ncbi:hypothetical protein K1719_000417 [Acacia pycnantha]|nr:hypothetical protein K1719_000417 [Acacia pycnantha]
MDQTSKLTKALFNNTKNPRLAWHLFKRILSSYSPSSSPCYIRSMPIIVRILIGAQMHREIDELPQLVLVSQHLDVALTSLTSFVQTLASLGHLDKAVLHFKSLRTRFPAMPPSVYLYNVIIQSSLKGNRPDFVKWLYSDMIAAGVKPETYTFNLLIQSFCDSGRLDDARDLFDKMSEKGCQPNEFSIGILVRGFCKAGFTVQGFELLNQTRNGHPSPNRVVYNTLVSSFCQEDRIDEAEKLVERMRDQGLFPDDVTFNSRISALCAEWAKF